MSKTPRTITWGYTAPENRPRTVMQIRRQRDTSQTHTFDARVPHNIQNAQYAAYNRTHLSKNASKPPRIMGWLHGAGEQLHPKRKWQHTVATHERPKSGSSPKHETPACGALPLGQIMPLVCLHQSPSSGAPAGSSSSRSVYLCSRGQKRRSNPP